MSVGYSFVLKFYRVNSFFIKGGGDTSYILNEVGNANILADNILAKAKTIEPNATNFMKSLEEAAANIGDSLRYTLVAEDVNYTQMVNDSLQQLQKNGYTVDKLKNYWGDDIYQGININVTSPEGIKIELQFHTQFKRRL